MEAGYIAKETHTTKDLQYYEMYRYKSFYTRYIKRMLDFFLSAIFLAALLPVYILISICIIVNSGFPVFYCAPRGGYKGRPFKICKFRTMVVGADKSGGGTTALNDSRITGVGALLRKTKLDELPQLWNVLKGEMSFIGPRPELLRYTSRYHGKEKYILSVRPGITDYSSVEFINLDKIVGTDNADANYEKYVLKRKNELRIKYVIDSSFKTDLTLFFKTVSSLFNKITAMDYIREKE